MMAIDGVGSTTVLTQEFFSSTTSVQGRDSDGDNDGSRVAGSGGGRFASAISQALTQIGVTPPDASSASAGATSATSTDTSPTQDPKQAERAFAQALFSALQGQSGAPGQTEGPHKGGGGHHHHGGGGGAGGASKIESGLQNLIQQLGASGTPTSGDSALTALQTSFNNLVTANGGNSSSASLTSFLQDLSQNLQGAPSTGNVVSTKV
jgi:hypothetical protein